MNYYFYKFNVLLFLDNLMDYFLNNLMNYYFIKINYYFLNNLTNYYFIKINKLLFL